MFPAWTITMAVAVAMVSVSGVEASIKMDTSTSTTKFIDEHQRTRIFHGVNAVYKIAPWHPTTSGFDSENTLSAIDSANLKNWGFNVVRLGVMWPGVEPGERGQYNQTYLDQIETLVITLAKDDIFVILDFHQDIWHRKFCGEGVPDYVYDVCVKQEPEGTAEFPLPSVNHTYPKDADGNPTLDACLSSMFATYYMSAEVGAGFQCLYDNKDNLWDALAGYWVAVAGRFASFENVLGYELVNEPWAGDVYAQPSNLLPGVAESKYLQPMYEHLHSAIRTVDDQKIIFFEGLTIDYWQNGFTAGPGGAAYNDRQVFAYHVYCPIQDPNAKVELACDVINAEFFAMREKDAARLGVGMVMTEFGAAEDVKGDMYALGKSADIMDAHQQSWMYWQFKYYQDITTCTPEGESLYNGDGTVCQDKLDVLSRTYPHAVAGQLVDFRFHRHTGEFKMHMVPLAVLPTTTSSTTTSSTTTSGTDGSDDAARTSEVFVNLQQTYPHGVNVVLADVGAGTGASALRVVCPPSAAAAAAVDGAAKPTGGLVSLVQIAAVPSVVGEEEEASKVEVTFSKCGVLPDSPCTCKYY